MTNPIPLPALPEPTHWTTQYGRIEAFTANQMRTYAESAIAALGSSMPSGEARAEEDAAVIDRLAKLLAGVAIALKGDELPLHRHSYHDLPELAGMVKLELDLYRAQAAATQPIESDDYECECGYGCPPGCGCRHSEQPTAAVQGGLTGIQNAADLMRIIDAYAFDYQADGKLGASRRDVERALRAALSANAGSQQGEPSEFWQWLPKAYRDSDANTSFTAYNMEVAFEAGRKLSSATPTKASQQSEAVAVDRGDAVNLARTMLEVRDCKGITSYGVRVLSEAVMAMDAHISATPKEAGSQQQAEELAALGWQAIKCPVCGNGARAFNLPKQPTAAGAVPTDEQIDREWHRVLMLPNASDHGYGRARNFARAVLALAAPADGSQPAQQGAAP